jgi:hypothetical protein
VLSRLISKLTYANVVATLALFLALGGGLAWALANNSVKSKHIKDGQVKPNDLSPASKPQVFSYSASTGDDVQEEIVDHEGYRVLAACDNFSGRPELEFFLELPEDGRMFGFLIEDASNAEPVPSSGPGSDVVGGDVFSLGEVTAPAGETDILFAGLTYAGSTEGATIDLHLVADDNEADTCTMRGTLTPGIIQPE